MVSFEPSEEQAMVKETISEFAVSEMQEKMRDCDESGQISPELVKTGWELEIIPSNLPEAYGGFGEAPSALTGVIAYEELAAGDLSTAMHIISPTTMAYTVLLYGTEEQKKTLLPGFCEDEFKASSAAIIEPRYNFCPSTLFTLAKLEGNQYFLKGNKCLVPLAEESENLIVFATTEPGAGFSGVEAFIVPRASENLVVSEREMNMGLKALATYEVTMNNVMIPAENRIGGEKGIDYVDVLSRTRLATTALAVGMMRRAAEHSRDYAKERVAFGEPIASRQTIAFMIAEMFIEVDATRMLLWDAAWRCDKGLDFTNEAAMAKHYAAQKVMQVCDYAVQVLGGHGYVRENPPELWFRNARAFSSLDGLVMV
ncbi:MAG: acyl-CoA dehydrogenase family protein [Actinobacteria bacterium]|nr:acyl-CoA dehydrogenase family protein [Actinomycetota bacterium]